MYAVLVLCTNQCLIVSELISILINANVCCVSVLFVVILYHLWEGIFIERLESNTIFCGGINVCLENSCGKFLIIAQTVTKRTKTLTFLLICTRFVAPLQLCCKFTVDSDNYNDNDNKLTSQM